MRTDRRPHLAVYGLLFPELRRFDRAAQRRRAWDAARPGRAWHLAVAVLAVLLIVPALVSLQWLGSLLLPGAQLPVALASIAATLAIMVAIFHALGRPIRRRLREQLVASGVPTCVSCGYDLTGAGVRRCPECGEATADPATTARRSRPDAPAGRDPEAAGRTMHRTGRDGSEDAR